MRDTLHWLPIRQRIFYRVAVLVWHCLLSIAPVYLQELCRPVSTLVGRQALRSSSGGKLLVPRVSTSTMQRRAFSVLFLEFTSLADSIVTKELHAFALQAA